MPLVPVGTRCRLNPGLRRLAWCDIHARAKGKVSQTANVAAECMDCEKAGGVVVVVNVLQLEGEAPKGGTVASEDDGGDDGDAYGEDDDGGY
ncbi:hypothetical protein NDU88_007973 [Pleurodeles waltl]|uniref:Uncharacterized protein n=1 Tax=Pleurodeles waltl TaxID=8319 RepID=A0AAV7STX6_PLEWA|nr:hypothetical protein NDU88_007973 [Pleurodeles waltl]